jgi:hypothetical protein
MSHSLPHLTTTNRVGDAIILLVSIARARWEQHLHRRERPGEAPSLVEEMRDRERNGGGGAGTDRDAGRRADRCSDQERDS